MKFLRPIFAHILARPALFFFPVYAVGMIVAAILGIPLLTGRRVQDSPEAITGGIYNFALIMLAALAVERIQRGLIGYKNQDGYSTHDTLCTLVLLVLCCYWVFR